MTRAQKTPSNNPEAGFTILEAVIATLILLFGLASIFNLMIVAVSNNSVANRGSGATTLAAQQMEILRSTPFSALADSPTDSLEVADPDFSRIDHVEGVASYETRWEITTLSDPNLKYLRVRVEPDGFRGRAARSELTTVRTCTTGSATGCL